MKVEELHLRNFKNHAETDLYLDKKINIFMGRNAAGKSSIKEAIEYLFTAAVRDYKKKDVDAYLARRGELSFEVAANIMHRESEMAIKRTGSIEGRKGKGCNVTQANLYAFLGSDEKVVRALFEIQRFMDAKEEERREIVIKLGGKSVTDNDLDLVGIIDETVRSIVKMRGPKKAIEHIVEQRRLKQGELRNIEEELPLEVEPTIFVDGGNGKEEEVDFRTLKPDQVKAARREYTEKAGALKEKMGAALDKDELVELIEEAERRIEGLDARIEKAKEGKQETKKLEPQIHEAVRAQATEQSKVRVLEGYLSKINAEGVVCPYGMGNECPLEVERVKLFLGGKLKGAQTKLDKASKELKKLEESKKAIDVLDANLNVLIMQRGDWDKKAEKAKVQINQSISEEETKNAKTQLEVIDKKIEMADTIIREQERYFENVKIREEKGKQVEQWKAKIEALANTEQRLKSGDLQKAIAGGPERELFEIAEQFKSIGLPFEVNDLYNKGQEMTLSHSETYRLGIIYKAALAKLAGLGVLILDDFEMLDAGNRKTVQGIIQKTLTWWDQVFIFCSQVRENVPKSAGQWNMWWVEDGKITKA